MTATGSWDKVRNVLCIRLDSLGDVLMTTPAIRALKDSLPGVRITLLTSLGAAEIVRLVPEIDDCIVYEAPWVKSPAEPGGVERDFAIIEELRRRKFDAAVVFTVYSQNPLPAAFLCHLAGIPLRLAHCRENPYHLLTHFIPEPEPDRLVRHEVRRQLDLVGSIGCYTGNERLSLRVPAVARRKVEALLEGLRLNGSGNWVVMHPGASAASRRYPPEGFAAAARALVEDEDLEVVFTGTADERELVEQIRTAMAARSHSLAARLDAGELAALLSLAPVLISNNTGPVHMAAALGTPVVDLYALTNPQHTPWGTANRVLYHDVPCKWCYKSVCPEKHNNCLRLVAPDAVVAAVRELLRDTAGIAPAAEVNQPLWEPRDRAA